MSLSSHVTYTQLGAETGTSADVARRRVAELVAAGKIEVVVVGRSTLVPREAIEMLRAPRTTVTMDIAPASTLGGR